MAPSKAKIQAALGQRSDSFIYFSDYEVYQKEHSNEYVYQENGVWVHSNLPPPEIPESKLRASPRVEITMDGTPESEHAAVKQAHPHEGTNDAAVVASQP